MCQNVILRYLITFPKALTFHHTVAASRWAWSLWGSVQADSVVGTADVSEASFITMLTLSVS